MDDANSNKLSDVDIAMEQKQIADEQLLQHDVYFLKEQVRIHKENVDREMAELWNMVAAVSIRQGRYGNTLGADRPIVKQLGTVQNYFNQFTDILKGINLSKEPGGFNKSLARLRKAIDHLAPKKLKKWISYNKRLLITCSQEMDKHQALQLFDKRLERPLDDELQLFGKGPERPSDDELQLFDKRPESLLLDGGTGFEMYNAPSSQEDLKGIQKPQVFDENPRNKLIEEHPQV
ncbi:hypothetical protein BUALT_Bualt03G0156000 [Buddleja alternifolia]|uniref:Uncharacterized protein n=1 Tax=Buddleja alternifolia TaxID=168488 RepID=A0AAV6XYD9_9LAMI|nr:hypothetical protein BUALT_Bualt03G0156000 [Buddleja alternifolia]